MISSRRFSLAVSEPDPAQLTPPVSENSIVIDLEEEDGNADTNLPQQNNGNANPTSASGSHPSLPCDEIKEEQNDSTEEKDMQELNGEPLSDDASNTALRKGDSLQDSTLAELEAAKVPHELVSPGFRNWHEDSQSHLKASPIAKPTPEIDDDQQSPNEQPPKIAQCPSVLQATDCHDAYPVDRSTTPSSPKISRASSRQICDTNLVAGSTVERTSREEDRTEPPNDLPQDESADTQTSTVARVDELLHLAGADSDLNNIGSSPGKVTITTDTKAETMGKDRLESGTDLAVIGDGSMESDDQPDLPHSTSLPARGRPKAVQTYKLKGRLKRKLKSPEKDASLQSETPTKRRKTQDPESSMGGTIEVQPRSSRRKGMTASQASKREIWRVSASPAEPDLSSPSQGTVQSQGTGAQSYEGLPPLVLFSSNSTVDEKPHLMAFFNRQGGMQVKAVKDCTILCVGPGELKKTSKLLLAVVLGKDIVRDKWLVDSARQGRLLDLSPYAAEDSNRAAEWGTKLGDAIARGKAGTKPFVGWTFYFTPSLKRELGSAFLELAEITILAGAAGAYARLPHKVIGPSPSLVVVVGSNDRDAPTLAEAGWSCYSKDIISLSVLQGRVNTESFRLDLQPTQAEPNGGRRSTKR